MDQILVDMGLKHYVPIFKQNGVCLNTFTYIMSKGNDTSKKIIAKDTGL